MFQFSILCNGKQLNGMRVAIVFHYIDTVNYVTDYIFGLIPYSKAFLPFSTVIQVLFATHSGFAVPIIRKRN